MNEEAFKDSYKLFLAQGYNGTTEEYKDLISTNPEAFKDAYRFFLDDGYNGDENEFSLLIGVQPGKKDVVVEEDVVTATEEVSASGVGPLAPQEEGDQFDIGKQLAPSKTFTPKSPKLSVEVDEVDLDEEELVPLLTNKFKGSGYTVAEAIPGADGIKITNEVTGNSEVFSIDEFTKKGDEESANKINKWLESEEIFSTDLVKQEKARKEKNDNYFNSLEPEEQKTINEEVKKRISGNDKKLKEEKDKIIEDMSYLDKLGVDVRSGLSRSGEMISSIGEGLYNVFATPQNIVAALIDEPALSRTAAEFKEKYNINNVALENYGKERERLAKVAELYNKNEYQYQGVAESFSEGEIMDGFKQIGSGLAESAPISIAMMLGGSTTSMQNLALGSTVAFMGSEIEEQQKQNPDQDPLISTVKGVGLAAAETVFSSINAKAFTNLYKGLVRKEGVKKAGETVYKGIMGMYESMLKKFGAPIAAFGEGIEEVATTMTQNLINDVPLMENTMDSFILGTSGGTMYGAPVNAINVANKIPQMIANNKISKELVNGGFPSAYDALGKGGDITDAAIKIFSNKNSVAVADSKLDEELSNGEITEEEANQAKQKVREINSISSSINPLKLSSNANTEAIKLIVEKENLKKKIEQVNESALTIEESTRIKEIDSRLTEVVQKDKVEKATAKGTQALEQLEGVTVISKENNQEVEEVLSQLIKEGKLGEGTDIKQAAGEQALIAQTLKDGSQVIIINKGQATKDNATKVINHEGGHAILYNAIKNNPALQIELGKSLKNHLLSIDASLLESKEPNDYAARLKQYQESSENVKAEESLTLLIDAINNGQVKPNDSVIAKIKDIYRRIVQTYFGADISFDKDVDVFNFLKDLNKSISKGKLTPAQKKFAKGTVAGKIVEVSIKEQKVADALKEGKTTVDALQKYTSSTDSRYGYADIIDKNGRSTRIELTKEQFERLKIGDRKKADIQKVKLEEAKQSLPKGKKSLMDDLAGIKLSKSLTSAQESEINKIGKQIDDLFDKRNIGEISFSEFESQEAALEAKIKQIEEQKPTETKVKPEPKAKEGAKPVTEAGKAASEKVQKIYEEKGVDGSFEIIKEFGGMVAGIVNKRENAPGFDRQLLTDEINTGKGGLIDLIRTYKPESGVPLAAYINKNLPLRAIAASERILETDFTKDIEGEGMRGIASDDVLPFESTSTAIEIAEEDARVADLIKPAEEFIADEVALNKAIDTIEEVTKDIPAKERTFAKIGVKKDDATLLAVLEPISEELNISVKKLSDKKTVFNRDDYKSARVWANENLDLILKLLPKGAIPPGGLTSKELQGSATNLPNNILQELYNKNPRFTKKNGLAPFILKRGLDKTDVLKAFGMDANGDLMVTVDASGRGRESKTLQGMINLMARLSANQLIREYGDVTAQEKQDIAAGKADIMFSKAIVPTKEKADIVSALDSEAVKSVFGSTNKDAFESMASKIRNTPDLNYDKLRKIILEATKNTLSTRQRRAFERVLFEAATPDIETFNKIFAEYRKLFKYEQQIIGFSVAKNVLNKTFNAAKGKEAKTKAIAEWLKIVSRSIRTLGIDGNTTNEKIFNNILLKAIPNIKDYGFDLLTETKNGKKLTFITLNENKLTGLADITEVKKDFKNNVERINKEAKEAQNFIISQIEGLSESEAIGFIALMTADQRGAVRKSSSAGFSVIGENISNLILEHETTALEIQQEYVKFAKGDISEKQLREFLAKAKVNLVTKEMDAALNSDKSIIGEARYEIPAFLELKNKANIDTNENINPDLTKSKEKAAEGNNKALPKDLQLEGNPTVQETIDNAEVIYDNEVEQQIKFSKKQSLNKTFNDIIENKTGIPSSREVSAARAKVRGDGKGRFKFFIPPTAEDFVGLLYTTLGKGKVGDTQMAWYKENLLDPYAAAMRNISAARISMMKNYNALVDKLDITPKDLAKKIPGSDFTREQAVRYHIWTKQGNTIPGINDSDKAELGEFMNKNPELQQFANTLIALTKNEGYAKPEKSWITGTITTDLLEVLNTDTRVKYLQVWQNNVDEIFSSNNLNKLEAAFGSNYRDALENSLDRMESGRNRSPNMDRLTGRFMDYLNASTGVIMFFNTRSAILQTISSINFINWSDNNPIAAGKAFANQKQYWKDFKYLFNSDYLVDRRGGLKMEVEEAEIANLAKKDGPKAVIARLLQLGFTPTQIADSFAISTGGATFYRNRINSLMKADDTLSQAEAEQIAFDDFREAAEDSQQSSRPDKISQQQAGPLGRIILAFANTPAQYARLTKKAILDLKNGRGDAKTNISKIVYYMAVQNLIFTALQQALIGLAFDDEDEEGLTTDKTINVANSMLDSILRGIGIAGAVVSTIKNVGLKIYRESEKDRPKYSNVADELLKISPPISSKYGKIKSVGKAFEWDKDKMETMGFDIQNPAYLAAGNTVAAVGNIPLDRLIRKAQNVEAAITEDMHAYQRIGLALGWDKWSLGLTKKEQEAEKAEKAARKAATKKARAAIKKEMESEGRPTVERETVERE